MKSRNAFLVLFCIFNIVSIIPSVLFASQIADGMPAPELTNSNISTSAYFWVKTSDGKTKIVELPPESKMQLPPDTVNYQFLYMEKSSENENADNASDLQEKSSNDQERARAEEEALRAIVLGNASLPTDESQPVSFESTSPAFPVVRIVPRSERYRPRGRFYRVQQFFQENW